jgi:hypothetical protein
VLLLLVFATDVEDGCAADRQRRHVEDQGHLVGERFLVERTLIVVWQAQPAVFLRKTDSSEPSFVQTLLEFPRALPGRVIAAIPWIGSLGVDPRHVIGQPVTRAGSEFVDRLRCRWRLRKLRTYGHAAESIKP